MPFFAALKIVEEPPAPAFDRNAAEVAMDLLPIAAAVVALGPTGLQITLSNVAFRRLGLGTEPIHCALTRDLGDALVTFLNGDSPREQRGWRTGDTVEQRWFDVTFARIDNGHSPRCLVTLVDQTRGMRTEASLRREMSTDSLTGLPNRAGFGDLLEARIGTGLTNYAVLVIDLDRFGRVNSCLGSMAGDEMLITVARRIKGSLRGGDVLGRIGGDEFSVLLETGGDRAEASRVARRIQKLLSTPVRLSDFEIRITCAIGIAFGAEETDDAEDVIRNAQFAVRRSKETGQAEAYDTRALDRARERFGMETALRRAIEAEQLQLHYQPICDLATGRIVAFEALARWTAEDGSEIAPADFIPVAEESGLIVPLGRWVIDQALRTLAAWDSRSGGKLDVQMAVNVSPIQLQRDRIPPLVTGALAAHGLAGSRLKLELTESALIADPDGNAEILRALKATGATIAMDDFGTGYSNLAYLQQLPIDTLKIDRSFVTGMMADRDKIAIVRAVLSLATALGMATVAEGIETSAVAQTLSALGCTYGQGYHFSRPLPAEQAYELLVASSS
ncbi:MULTISPECIES: putative bifunctional diguanylate cyclase/phosphodiesterase [unclassified Sphingomonas]|uniref:putative bifunctional diguanylate cyclase/phosphodiesterase n=1 Tax=unclassified Sphingomonas TaxID=196159 RepID=UPI001D1250F9|nr:MULTISPECIES: bifunctional diguanylate cyclase/phosphodiesterase [unclassified Sphingomonas]MCC2978691.1 bifunctional diguanylate cyclase/phosphodiesterase [Sphingomonas sp. IC4-52]MCD2316022.1 bifunctional diguanylate cyclase/phosphodiesterase [Sphingomonas sp. IC-11]